jgi:hypothetical protein
MVDFTVMANTHAPAGEIVNSRIRTSSNDPKAPAPDFSMMGPQPWELRKRLSRLTL